MIVSKDQGVEFTPEDRQTLIEYAKAVKKHNIVLNEKNLNPQNLWISLVTQYLVKGSSTPINRLMDNKQRYSEFLSQLSLSRFLKMNHQTREKVLADLFQSYKATRFYNTQARAIATFLDKWDEFLGVINSKNDSSEIRKELVNLIPGFNMKSASDYLITIGMASDFIAFDTRIQKIMENKMGLTKREAGYIRRYPKVYESLEKEIISIIKQTGISLSQLDRVMYKMGS